MLYKRLFILLLIGLICCTKAKGREDSTFFNPIIAHAQQIKLERNSIENLSHQLTFPYDTDIEKVAAIYTWLALNIDYDIKRINTFRTYKNEKEVLEYVVKNNTGVCLHYCVYFNELCKYANIETTTISGFVKQQGIVKQTPHTWNAVKLNESWYMLDITWAAGYVMNNSFHKRFDTAFFMLPPGQFISTHIPFDKLWQFVDYPVTFDDFVSGERTSDSVYFNYTDTLIQYLSASKCEKLIHEKRRIGNNGNISTVVSNELKYKQQNIEICIHNQQAELINKGVAYYEKAVQQFNHYIQLYNGRFKNPTTSDDELTLLMANLSSNISKAKDAYHHIQSTNSEINEAVQLNLQSLNELEVRITKERRFITKYLSTSHSNRKQLFYDRKFM